MIARTVEQFNSSGISVHPEHEVLKVDVDNKVVTVKNLTTNEVFDDYYDRLMVATCLLYTSCDGMSKVKDRHD